MNKMVTIPQDEYDRLREAADDLADLRTYDRAKTDLAAGEDELIPEKFAKRLIAGENPLRVYRDLRGLTQQGLSDASEVNRVQIADIEAGRSKGSVVTLGKLATALGLAIDDLI
jgi:DNA-binding XRE family transcriptional regulator